MGELAEISKVGMVWRPREWWYGHVGLRDAGEDSTSSAYRVHLTIILVVAVEMEGEEISHNVICCYF